VNGLAGGAPWSAADVDDGLVLLLRSISMPDSRSAVESIISTVLFGWSVLAKERKNVGEHWVMYRCSSSCLLRLCFLPFPFFRLMYRFRRR
jgi:hypothetical protein